MKKYFLFISLTILSYTCVSSQEKNQKSSNSIQEVKLNMTNIIAFKWLDAGYEYILNEESSIGIGALISVNGSDNEATGLDEYRKFSLTPYYRHFFSKKYAQGFFVEAFSMLHSGKDEVYYEDTINGGSVWRAEKESYTDFAIGISAGGKFISKRGFIAEVYLGIGRDMLGQSDLEVVGRGGVAFGYRF